MATFLSKKGGFKAVKHVNGSPYNGQSNIYVVASGQSFVPGDVVKLTGTSVNGLPEVTAATAAASEVITGVVVGVVPGGGKLDPVYGKMSTGTISLDTPQTAGAGAYVYVADSPDVVYSVEKATFTATDTGANLDISGATGGNTVGVSNQILGTGTTAGNFKVIGLDLTYQSLDPTVAGQSGYAQPVAGDTNPRVLVVANAHVYQGGTTAV
jgi:hypothetical protein